MGKINSQSKYQTAIIASYILLYYVVMPWADASSWLVFHFQTLCHQNLKKEWTTWMEMQRDQKKGDLQAR